MSVPVIHSVLYLYNDGIFNPFTPIELSYLNVLNRSTSSWRCLCVNLLLSCFIEFPVLNTNSVEPDQMMSLLWNARPKWVKTDIMHNRAWQDCGNAWYGRFLLFVYGKILASHHCLILTFKTYSNPYNKCRFYNFIAWFCSSKFGLARQKGLLWHVRTPKTQSAHVFRSSLCWWYTV